MSPRILLAGLFHETHTFVEEVTGADQVRVRRGPALLDRRGDGSTVDGFLSVAARRGWEVVPSIEVGAMPSGTLDHAVFEAFWEAFAADARAAGSLDGVWLSLHGAMVTTEEVDPEGEFLARLRALPGFAALPVFGVFDLHAAFTPRMARHADGLVAYRENPHADAREAAVRSAELLARALDTGVRPRMLTRTLPIVWPPTGTGTADSPMGDLEAAARAIEADPAVWAANVVAGYSFADTPDTGVSVSLVTTGDPADGERHLDRLAAIAWENRQAGIPREWDLKAALDDALSRRLAGPVVIVEPADNIGGGAPGDCTTILRAFLHRRLDPAAVVIADPAAVQALAGASPGDRVALSIGGKGSRLDPGPVAVEAELVSRSDGRFTLEDRQSHLAASQGVAIDMGPCATVRVGGVSILLTSRKTPPFDLAQLRSQGIAPETLAFVGVKAAVAHRRAYDPIAAASYTVATPGPCASDLARLPYRRIRRPVFPLDP
ncbi:MAG TPA: M81 family metallopeptidase [Beijerinckiaceae bacterium]|nr:M81 family metallopeptidase [Beijerinckiaceae bacterium]